MSKRNVEFDFDFIGVGSIVCEEGDFFHIYNPDPGFVRKFDKHSTIILDVGNCIKKGVIDHHHLTHKIKIRGKEYGSATGILSASEHLLSNVMNKDKITIVVHIEPDMDCIASAYLAKEYICNSGKLPQYCELLVDYVELVDSGKMTLDKSSIKAPFAIITAISEVIRNDNVFGKMLNVKTMEKGIAFLEYIMNKVASMDEVERCLGLNNPALLEGCNEYDREIKLLHEDYDTYISEREDINICTKRKMRLPLLNDDTKSLKEVDALFWHCEPNCKLHKYWARQDKQSFSGNGYIMTFIPVYKDQKLQFSEENTYQVKYINNILNLLKKNEYEDIGNITTSRVIISVDPNSAVTLAGLGSMLEEAEQRAEKLKFKELHKLWRDTGKKRFDDGVCKNSDPWYDGRGFNYTIIDGPRIGSLLTVEQIESIVLNYSKPVTNENYLRFVIPFSYDIENKKNLFSDIESNTKLKRDYRDISTERSDYFIQYIRSYYFNMNKMKNDKTYTKHLVLDDVHISEIKDIFNNIEKCAKLGSDKQQCLLPVRPLEIEVKCLSVTLFVYGTGFLTVDTCIKKAMQQNDILQDDNIYLDDVLNYANLICNDKCVNSNIAKLINGNYKVQVDKPIVYAYLDVREETFSNECKREAVYKLSNGIRWDESYSESEYIKKLLEKSYYEIEEYASCGLSKNGYAVLVSANEYEKNKILEKVQQIKTRYLETDFDIFMLTLHQRNTLMNLSTELSKYWTKKNNKKIGILRDTMMDFTTMAWFTQVTKNEIGMMLYKSWFEIFDNEALYEEVYGQICAIDDYSKNKTTKNFEQLSAVIFPFVIIGTFIQMKLIDLEPIVDLTGDSMASLMFGWLPMGLVTITIFFLIRNTFDK